MLYIYTENFIYTLKDGCSTVAVLKVVGLDWMDGSLSGANYRESYGANKTLPIVSRTDNTTQLFVKGWFLSNIMAPRHH